MLLSLKKICLNHLIERDDTMEIEDNYYRTMILQYYRDTIVKNYTPSPSYPNLNVVPYPLMCDGRFITIPVRLSPLFDSMLTGRPDQFYSLPDDLVGIRFCILHQNWFLPLALWDFKLYPEFLT